MDGASGQWRKGKRGKRGVLFPLLEIGIVHHDGVVLGDKFGCFFFGRFVPYLTPNLIVACIASPPLLAYAGVRFKNLVLPRDRGITREGAMQEFLVEPKVQGEGVLRIVAYDEVYIIIGEGCPTGKGDGALHVGKDVEAVSPAFLYGQGAVERYPIEKIAQLT